MEALLTKVRSRMVDAVRKRRGYPVVRDAFNRGSTRSRRALLAYLVEPFADPWRRERLVRHHHILWRVQEIATILDAMDFCVDVVQWVDKTFSPTERYGLLVGTGATNIRLAEQVPTDCITVGLATGCEAGYNNQAETERLDKLYARRGRQLAPRRLAPVYSDALGGLDALGVMGNRFTAQTFAPFHARVRAFNNHRGDEIHWCDRDPDLSASHFLYVASAGQVHRGLDLLLEVFAQLPSCHLHICGPVKRERDFFQCYRHELCDLPNIHLVGFIPIPSARFFDLCSRCASVILPSCAEGQSGSVVAAMHAGLMPIVSRETGITVDDFGVLLAECSQHAIGEAVERMAARAPEQILAGTRRVRTAAVKSFSNAAFTDRFRTMLTEIVESA